ncbi:hypothetical protein J7J60_00175 [bacterium]|nr:hypothetical protein [bacterium]
MFKEKLEEQKNNSSKKEKQEMPQTDEYGISADYINEWAWFEPNWFKKHPKAFKETLERIAKEKNGNIILKYEERYPPDKYKKPVHENEQRIQLLNKIAETANKLFKKNKLTQEKFSQLQKLAIKIIRLNKNI